MSGNSGRNSGSPQKGFFKRMLGQEPGDGAKQSNIKQRHPGFKVSDDTVISSVRTARPQEVIISPAVRQLNKDGYYVYNTPEKEDIYVTIQPDSAFFEEEEPVMVRMAGGSFVGAKKDTNTVEVPRMESEPESEPIVYTQPADMFSNASRREALDEIDFNEVIIKKNESFEEEFENAPLFEPSIDEMSEPVYEGSSSLTAEAEIAKTSTEVSDAAFETDISSVEYVSEQEYAVEEVVAAIEDPASDELDVMDVVESTTEAVTDVPAGLYVEGHKPIDAAEADVDESSERSTFVEPALEAETALTSESGCMMSEAVMSPMSYIEGTSALEENDATVMTFEDASDTIAQAPVVFDILDPVADIMRITVPGLHISDVLLEDLSRDWEMHIPDDGLEALDDKFIMMDVPKAEVSKALTISFGFDGSESAVNPDPSVNFRF